MGIPSDAVIRRRRVGDRIQQSKAAAGIPGEQLNHDPLARHRTAQRGGEIVSLLLARAQREGPTLVSRGLPGQRPKDTMWSDRMQKSNVRAWQTGAEF